MFANCLISINENICAIVSFILFNRFSLSRSFTIFFFFRFILFCFIVFKIENCFYCLLNNCNLNWLLCSIRIYFVSKLTSLFKLKKENKTRIQNEREIFFFFVFTFLDEKYIYKKTWKKNYQNKLKSTHNVSQMQSP